MKTIWTIAKREVFSFFVSPIAYVVLFVWLLTCGLSFWLLAASFAQQPTGMSATVNPLSLFYGGTTLFYIFILAFPPVLTMRLLAEEKSSGTIEPLLTAPVSDVALVLGKFAAAMVLWVIMWLPTLVYVWRSSYTGEEVIDSGAIAASYLGIFCIGLFYMALGLLMSALARNQIVAALLTFAVLAGLFVLGLGQFIFTGDDQRAVSEYISLWTQMGAFSKGIVDTRHVVFDLSLAAVCLFLTVRMVQTYRLRG